MESMLTVITEDRLRELLEEVIQKISSEKETKSEEKVEYLDRKQVAKMLDVSLTTIDKWRKDKVLRYHKPPGAGRVRFIRSEVHEDMKKTNFQR